MTEQKIEITEDIATRVRDTVRAGLSHGIGTPKPGDMCVEAAVCYALGISHGDDPPCVDGALRAFKISLNDSAWSTALARAKGLERLALAQLGSAGVLKIAVNTVCSAMREVADRDTRISELSGSIKRYADLIEADPFNSFITGSTLGCCLSCAVYYKLWDARDFVHMAQKEDQGGLRPALVAKYAARAVVHAGNQLFNSRSLELDKFLSDFAEQVVQLLVEMKAPGAKWLYLTDSF